MSKKFKKQLKIIFNIKVKNVCLSCGVKLPLSFSYCDSCEEIWWETGEEPKKKTF